ncbi:MAG: anthranilate synthase component 1, partial [Halioglobus sp.]
MNSKDFAAFTAQNYNRIPVSREVLADLETPISAYRKLAEGPYSYFFESVQGGEKWGRYSIIGLPCRTVLKVYGYRAEIWVDGELLQSTEVEDPLSYIEDFQQRYRAAPDADLPVFHGGLVGYFGYDTVRYIEPRLQHSMPPDELGTPDILLMVSDEVLVFDNLAGTIRLVVNSDPVAEGAYELAQWRLKDLETRLPRPMKPLPQVVLDPSGSELLEAQAASNFTQEQYE